MLPPVFSLATRIKIDTEMASARAAVRFDPEEHPGTVYDAFADFVDSFAYEYEALGRVPPTGTPDAAAWTNLDKRKQFLGRYASRQLQLDFEAETTTAERAGITFDDMVTKLKARYKPTQNTTMLNFLFHRLRQEPAETYDAFVKRVTREAASCNFQCEANNCGVRNVLIRDQIIIGMLDEGIRKKALEEEWGLEDLVAKGRKMEAAVLGSERIKSEVKLEGGVARVTPGRYSRKSAKKCKNCTNRKCKGGNQCFGHDKECFLCGALGHVKGAANCSGKAKKKPPKTRRVKDRDRGSSGSSSSSSSDDDNGEVKRVASRIHPAEFVAHVRRSRRSGSSPKRLSPKRSRYQVPVLIKERVVSMFADTGADISVISRRLAKELQLPLIKTKMRLKPYGGKRRIKCVGYYVGPVMYEGAVANVGVYVVKDDVEPLLSGGASEALGILTFHGDQHVRRSVADEKLTDEDPVKQVYLSKFPEVFTGVGTFPDYVTKYYVDEDVPPVASPPRSHPYHLQASLDREIEKLEEAGVVEDHDGPSPWVSNLVLAPKDDGGVRVTLDMREPNKAIRSTGLPIPLAEDIRKEFVGCSVFTKLDFKTAFYQIKLAEESRYLTVFAHKNRLKRFTRLTMGAKPASGELNKALRPVFSSIPGVHIIHDDVVIATPGVDEHRKVLDEVLQLIKEKGLTLNPAKCIFQKDEIPFWGMVIGKDGVKPDPAKVLALREADHPETKGELMSFLCMLQASAEFIPGLSIETTHLRKLTTKSKRFRWTEECQEEFERVKELLCEDALLRYFDPSLPTFLFVDAHQTGLSAILAQGPSREEAKMVTCASRATTPTERRYAQLDLEALAVDFGLRRFRQYLVGDQKGIVVASDHKPLVSIFKNTRCGSVRTDRIKLRHQDIKYTVVFQAGSSNRADFLSRRAMRLDRVPTEWTDEAKELEKTIWFLNLSPYSEAVSLPNIIEETAADKLLRKLKGHLKRGFIPGRDKKELGCFVKVWGDLTVSDAGLVLKGEKIVLPESLWQLAVDKAHQGGHPGMSRMKARIRNHFWIPGLNSLVEKKLRGCEACQAFTPKNTKEPIAPVPTTPGVWEEVSVDLFGPLPDKRHVLVVQDTRSRFPAAAIVPGTAAQPVLKALDNVYTAYGQPCRHRTDNGPPFNSERFQEYSESKGIDHVKCFPHHPQGNPCETFMKPLGKALKAAYHHRDSAQAAIDSLLKAYRSTPHPATGMPPGDMLFRAGYCADFPRSGQVTEEDVVAAEERDKDQKQERKERVNASRWRVPMSTKEGDKVLLRTYPPAKKFQPIYGQEVYEVVKVEEKGVTVRDSRGKTFRRHKDDIKRYFGAEQVGDSEPEDGWELSPTDAGVQGDVVEEEGAMTGADEQGEDQQQPTEQPAESAQPADGAGRARPQRQRRLPGRLKDFVVGKIRMAGLGSVVTSELHS